jgi:cytoplasmic iron level regulating protein YaaA (DUF328/UPF0246 family)
MRNLIIDAIKPDDETEIDSRSRRAQLCRHPRHPLANMPICLLSPAKTLNEVPCPASVPKTEPRMASHTKSLVAACAKLSASDIKSLMSVSADIASLNHTRFQNFHTNPAKQCAYAFDGPAYKALAIESMTKAQVAFAQQHVRILSGLNGLLRPLDAIKPYRLEMGTKLKTGGGSNLYEFWGDDICEAIARDVEALTEDEGKFVVNVASQEYYKSVGDKRLKALGVRVVTCVFPGPAVYAKGARGAMCRHVVVNEVTDVEGLKAFVGNDGEWSFSSETKLDDKNMTLTFSRSDTKKKAAATGGKKAKAAKASKPAPTKATAAGTKRTRGGK